MLVIAVSFPVGYGTWDLIRRRKWNVISILGALVHYSLGESD